MRNPALLRRGSSCIRYVSWMKALIPEDGYCEIRLEEHPKLRDIPRLVADQERRAVLDLADDAVIQLHRVLEDLGVRCSIGLVLQVFEQIHGARGEIELDPLGLSLDFVVLLRRAHRPYCALSQCCCVHSIFYFLRSPK